MSWHYLPVWEREEGDDSGERFYSICEVYLDENDKLEFWTKGPSIGAGGSSIDDLLGDLELMMRDVKKWKAVGFSALEKGMKFEKIDHPPPRPLPSVPFKR